MTVYIDMNYINIRQIAREVEGIPRGEECGFTMINGSTRRKKTSFVPPITTHPPNTDVRSPVHKDEFRKALKTERHASWLPKPELARRDTMYGLHLSTAGALL